MVMPEINTLILLDREVMFRYTPSSFLCEWYYDKLCNVG